VGARDQAVLVTRRPLAVVVELRLDALERVEQLVTLLLKRLELRGLLNLLGVLDILSH
jgi:hypothetical protein